MSLRLTTTKAKLQEMGEETEYACETLSAYRDLILGLTANTSAPVDIFDASGQYKGTTQAMRELSKVVDELDTKQLSALTYALFGQRQSNVGLSLLKNFKDTEAAIKAAQSASEGIGSAMQEQERWAESLEAKINDVTTAMQSLSADIFDTDTLKAAVSAVADLIVKFDELVKKIDASKMLLGVFAAWAAKVKNVYTASFTEAGIQVHIFGQTLTLFQTSAQSVNNQLAVTTSTAQAVTRTMTAYNATLGQTSRLQTMLATTIPKTTMQQYLVSLNGAEASLQGYCTWLAQSAMVQEDANIVIERYNSLHAFGANAQAIFRAEIAKTNPVMAQYLATTTGASASMRGYTAAQRTATITTKALTVATTLLKTAMFAVATIAVSAVVQAVSNASHKYEELIKKVSETASAFDEEKKKLDDLKTRYTDLLTSTETEAEKEAKLKDIKKQLVEQYGLEADKISEINQLREEGIKIFDDLSRREMIQASADMQQGFENAVKEIKYNTSFTVGDYSAGILGDEYIDNSNVRQSIKDLFDFTEQEVETANYSFIRDVLGFEEKDAVTAYNRLGEILTQMWEIKLTTGEFTEDEQKAYDVLSETYDRLTKKYAENYEAAKKAQELNARLIYDIYTDKNKSFEEVYGTDEYEQWYAGLVQAAQEIGEDQVPYVEAAFVELFNAFKENIGKMTDEAEELEDPLAKIKALILSAKQALSELDGKTDESAKKLDDLVKIISDNKDSDKFFSSKEIIEYLDTYPDLVNAIEQTAYGYKLNENALEEFRKKMVETEKTNLQTELNKSKDTLAEAQNRIEAYKAEILAKEAAVSAAANTEERSRYYVNINQLKKKLQEATSEFDGQLKRVNKIQRQIDILGTKFNDIKDTTTETNAELDRQKDILKEETDDLKEAQDYINDLVKLTIDMIKKQKELEKEALKDKLDAYKKSVELKKQELEMEKDIHDFQKDLADKNKTVTDLKKKIEDLSIDGVDYSLDDIKRRNELLEEYSKSKEELDEFLYEHEIDTRTDALDREADLFEDQINTQTKSIEEYLKREGDIRQAAIDLINGKTQEFYNDLYNYTTTYTDKSDYEFNKLWNNAYSALEKYGNGQIGVAGVLAYLDAQLVYTDNLIKQIESDMQRQSNSTVNAINAERWALEEYNNELEKRLTGEEKLQRTINYAKDNSTPKTWWSLNPEVDMSYLKGLPKFHDGGVVEGKSEIFAKLMGGEVVSTEKQAETFLSKTLPNLIGTGARVANNNSVSLTVGDMVINGNANQETVSALKNFKDQIVDSIFSRINAELKKKGIKVAY